MLLLLILVFNKLFHIISLIINILVKIIINSSPLLILVAFTEPFYIIFINNIFNGVEILILPFRFLDSLWLHYGCSIALYMTLYSLLNYLWLWYYFFIVIIILNLNTIIVFHQLRIIIVLLLIILLFFHFLR